jgi:peroxiredoxin (alkyl hydroperoxide reductase subunit C)
MFWKKNIQNTWYVAFMAIFLWTYAANAQSDSFKESIYPVDKMKPKDSITTLKVGDQAPDFTLPVVGGGKVSLSHYLGKKNVVISFVPAAWTPVCSAQWPGYNIAQDIFDKNNAVLIGITVDNIPTLYAWTRQMCKDGENLWFPVLSDFFPHGHVAKKYSVLRSDGVSERALVVINKKGVIQYIHVYNINERPPLEEIAKVLEGLK